MPPYFVETLKLKCDAKDFAESPENVFCSAVVVLENVSGVVCVIWCLETPSSNMVIVKLYLVLW